MNIRIAESKHTIEYEEIEKRALLVHTTTYEWIDDSGDVVFTWATETIWPVSKANWTKIEDICTMIDWNKFENMAKDTLLNAISNSA
jgi:hypothetical protein